jgi:S-DNA-T family DNA segregation ATPase FtsK/SpoIIIE
MREGGGWIGYAVSTPLVALLTDMLAIPILILTLIFGALVITATPFSKVIDLIKSLFSGASDKVTGALDERR